MTQEWQPVSFDFLRPDWREVPSHIRAMSTLRLGGCSVGVYGDERGSGGLNLGEHVSDDIAAVVANREKLNASLPSDVIFLSQVHGNIVVHAENLLPGICADAVVTSTPGLVCAVLTADCLPVLFSDAAGRVVAAAHAGWRGLASGVLQNTVLEMRLKGAGEIFAWMGPAIGPEKFEVGQEVYDVFTSMDKNAIHSFVKITSDDIVGGGQKYLADIYQLARNILSSVGVCDISGGEYCTVSDKQKFYSYRRDGVTGRMASLIWIAAGDLPNGLSV
ncbi:peptidoglycan editing factor PgeF [Undibacterium sp. SXout11W]|uniref:peptidoglycan editing factor PgeF n=1 Tax=Undibacterium sp. SXout11W TaxID=3413050 RepID=UPI003BF23016